MNLLKVLGSAPSLIDQLFLQTPVFGSLDQYAIAISLPETFGAGCDRF
ncbi:hypothetical protein [Coleofasciculus sp. H7-2]